MLDQITMEVKIAIAMVLGIVSLIGVIYVYHLHNVVISQKATISELSSKIEVQNAAVITEASAAKDTQNKLNDANSENQDLSNKNSRLITEIKNQPKAKTCEEAVSNLSVVANKISTEFNGVQK